MSRVSGGGAPAAIWASFMQSALPRLAVQSIPNGPALPEGWLPPDPVGDALGQVEDPYAQQDTGVLDEDGMPTVATAPAVQDNPKVAPSKPEAERKSDSLFY